MPTVTTTDFRGLDLNDARLFRHYAAGRDHERRFQMADLISDLRVEGLISLMLRQKKPEGPRNGGAAYWLGVLHERLESQREECTAR